MNTHRFNQMFQMFTLILLLFMSSVPFPALASDTWQYIVPPGGLATQFIPASSDLYMLSNSRIYMSSNIGASWTLLSDIGAFVDTLAVDPTNPSHLLIGTGTEFGVMQSTDGGQTWQSIALNQKTQQNPYGVAVTGLAFTGNSSENLVATTNGTGIYQSADGGQTWTPAGQTTDQNILGMWQDPTAPQVLYVIAATKGIFKSIDGGSNWMAINSGLDPSLVSTSNNFHNIAFDPTNHNHIFLAGYNSYSSMNGGITWTLISGGLPIAWASQYTFLIDPANPGTMYAVCQVNTSSNGSVVPIWESTDGGNNWSPLPNPDGPFQGLNVYTGYIDPLNPAHIVIGTDRGVFSSTDSGNTWAPSNSGFNNIVTQNFVLDPKHPGTIYASSRDSGVLKSTDSGATWSETNSGILVPDIPYIGLDPQTSNTLFAAQLDGEMFISSNEGSTWTGYNDSPNPPASVDVVSMAFDPNNSDIIYASADAGVLKSTDGGQTWQLLTNGLPQPLPCFGCLSTLAITTTDPSILYIATGKGLYKSTDGAASWTNITDTSIGSGKEVADVAINPTNASTIYIAAPFSGAWKSTDGGSSWTMMDPNRTSITGFPISVAIDPLNPQHILVGNNSAGISISLDGGNTWGLLDPGLPPKNGGGNLSAFPISFDPTTGGRIYAVTNGYLQTYNGSLASNLVIAASAKTSEPTVEDTSSMTFSLTNTSTLDATNAQVQITFSTAVMLSGGNITNGSCNANNGVTDITCSVNSLPSNSKVSGNLTYTPLKPGTIVVNFTATSQQLQSNSSDNIASVKINAIAPNATSGGTGSNSNGNSGGGGVPILILIALLILTVTTRLASGKKRADRS